MRSANSLGHSWYTNFGILTVFVFVHAEYVFTHNMTPGHGNGVKEVAASHVMSA